MDHLGQVDRRSFLRAGALTTGALGGALLMGDIQDAFAATRAFSVNGTPHAVFRDATLSNPHESWQSIAWDTRHRRLFYAMPPHDPQKVSGQIRVSYLDLHGRSPHSGAHMNFHGFGNAHGLGVEHVGADTYLWMMADDNHSLCRFKWVGNGKLYKYSDRRLHPAPGYSEYNLTGGYGVSCASDLNSQRLLVRHASGGAGYVYQVFSFSDIRAGKHSRVRGTRTVSENAIFAKIHEPSYEPNHPHPNYQGMALYGNYAYVLSGHQWYETTKHLSCSPTHHHRGDVHLTRFDIRTGNAVNSRVITAESNLHNREPEGVAVVQTAHGPKLVFGLLNVPDCGRNKIRGMDLLAIS